MTAPTFNGSPFNYQGTYDYWGHWGNYVNNPYEEAVATPPAGAAPLPAGPFWTTPGGMCAQWQSRKNTQVRNADDPAQGQANYTCIECAPPHDPLASYPQSARNQWQLFPWAMPLNLEIESNIEPHDPRDAVDAYTEVTYSVSADEAQTYLQASYFVNIGWDQAGNPVMGPVGNGSIVEWEMMEGSAAGSLSTAETATEDGFTTVKLTTTRNVGSLYKVRAKLKRLDRLH